MRILKRLAGFIGTLVFLSFFVFLAFSVLPGDSAVTKLGTNATPEQISALREEMGLNDSVFVRYGRFLKGAVTGDFGESTRYKRSVSALLSECLPNTLCLTVLSLLLVLVFSIPFGVLSAHFSGRLPDKLLSGTGQLFMATPSFFMGIFLSLVFGVWLKWFLPGSAVSFTKDPAGAIAYMVYPALAIALPKIGMTARYLKNALLKEESADYVRTARSLGKPEQRILFTEMLPNALISVITFLGVVAAELLAGSIVIEQVFGISGIGRLLVVSVSNRDYNVISAIVLYIGLAVLLVNLLVDLLYGAADPRVRRKTE